MESKRVFFVVHRFFFEGERGRGCISTKGRFKRKPKVEWFEEQLLEGTEEGDHLWKLWDGKSKQQNDLDYDLSRCLTDLNLTQPVKCVSYHTAL